MNFKKLVAFVFIGVFVFSSTACGAKKVVSRVDTQEQIDLSGNWNDTDSQLVAKAMINEALSGAWIVKFKTLKVKEPKIIVGRIINKSEEHINTETFIKNLERALINSGLVEFVASSSQRQEIRQERIEQADNSRDAKRQGNESSADFMLQGTINTIFDQEAGTQVKYYQIDLELIDIETNVKTWIGGTSDKESGGEEEIQGIKARLNIPWSYIGAGFSRPHLTETAYCWAPWGAERTLEHHRKTQAHSLRFFLDNLQNSQVTDFGSCSDRLQWILKKPSVHRPCF